MNLRFMGNALDHWKGSLFGSDCVSARTREEVATRINEVVDTLRGVGQFSWCSYESGTVAMLFFSRDTTRIVDIGKHFHSMLGRHALGRIRCSEADVVDTATAAVVGGSAD